MKNITQRLEQLYLPLKALVIYQPLSEQDGVYVEAYDIHNDGSPINAHPLSQLETIALAKCLNTVNEVQTNYLECKGLLPEKLLCLNNRLGYAVWQTPEQQVSLHFVEGLTIPSGMANVPAMVWKADRNKLSVYALKNNRKPKSETQLYHAPYFNVFSDGGVCLGTAEMDVCSVDGLEDFMNSWEQVFWNSYFSHLNGGHSPVNCNIVQLWQDLVATGNPFPTEVLIKSGKTLKELIT